MSYIGSLPNLEIYASNVRDDLIPAPPQQTFVLSQEVPGGYESNVFVIRRKFVQDDVVSNNSHLSISQDGVFSYLTCSSSLTSALLSRIQIGHSLITSGFANSHNNGTFVVLDITYADPNITIKFTYSNQVNESPVSATVHDGHDGAWEVLEPEIDYTIAGTGANYNKELTLTEVLQLADVCYVIHKGEATYNMVPSARSVGPDQLQDNLRNFATDRFTGTGAQQDFILSQAPINGHAIVVTVNGVTLDGDDVSYSSGDWILTSTTLHFKVAPALNAKIKVLHLGFSTVSRRVALSQGQVSEIGPGQVTTDKLADTAVNNAKLADNSVSTSKLQDDSVTGAKIQLNNEDPIYALKNGGGVQALIRLNASNQTILSAVASGTLVVEFAGVVKHNFTSTTIEPQTTAQISLGTASKKFLDGHFSGAVTVDGNVSSANITQDELDIDNIQAALANGFVGGIPQLLVPPGTIVPFAGTTDFSTGNKGWLYCRGQAVSKVSFAALYAALGNGSVYGESGGNFNLPDLRESFVLGKTNVAPSIDQANVLGHHGGSANHTHTTAHTHNLSASGTIADHNHSQGTLYFLGSTIEHRHDVTYHYHRHDHLHTIGAHYHRGIYINAHANPDSGEHTHSVGPDGTHYHDIPAKLYNIKDGYSVDTSPMPSGYHNRWFLSSTSYGNWSNLNPSQVANTFTDGDWGGYGTPTPATGVTQTDPRTRTNDGSHTHSISSSGKHVHYQSTANEKGWIVGNSGGQNADISGQSTANLTSSGDSSWTGQGHQTQTESTPSSPRAKSSKIDCSAGGSAPDDSASGSNWVSGTSSSERPLSGGTTGSPSSVTQSVSGATTSQSTSVSGPNNPPYIVLEYIIKT